MPQIKHVETYVCLSLKTECFKKKKKVHHQVEEANEGVDLLLLNLGVKRNQR